MDPAVGDHSLNPAWCSTTCVLVALSSPAVRPSSGALCHVSVVPRCSGERCRAIQVYHFIGGKDYGLSIGFGQPVLGVVGRVTPEPALRHSRLRCVFVPTTNLFSCQVCSFRSCPAMIFPLPALPAGCWESHQELLSLRFAFSIQQPFAPKSKQHREMARWHPCFQLSGDTALDMSLAPGAVLKNAELKL